MQRDPIPQATIDAIARSILARTSAYGFTLADEVRLATALLSLCDGAVKKGARIAGDPPQFAAGEPKGAASRTACARYRLRSLDNSRDVAVLARWLADDTLREAASAYASPTTTDPRELAASPWNHLVMIETESGRPLGFAGYLDVHPVRRRAELVLLIGDLKSRGVGLGDEILREWVEHGWAVLKLRKIYARVLEADVRWRRLLQRCGFFVEGALQAEVVQDVGSMNVLLMGLVKEPLE